MSTLGSTSLFAPWPSHSDNELQAVHEVLRSGKTNYWTGNVARAFEKEYATSPGQRYWIARHNRPLALELALVACNIGPGDEVITTARTFIASASAIVMRGAKPIIADVDPNSGNLTVETVEPHISP